MRLCAQAAVFKLQQTQEMKKDVRAENKGYANIRSLQQQGFTLIACSQKHRVEICMTAQLLLLQQGEKLTL